MEGHKYAVMTQYENDGWVVLGTTNSLESANSLVQSSSDTHWGVLKQRFSDREPMLARPHTADKQPKLLADISIRDKTSGLMKICWQCRIVKTTDLPQFGITKY